MASKKSNQSIDKPKAKRAKLESGGSTSSKPEAKEPFLSLPSDVLAKIISDLPVAQWSSLESLDNNFRAATWIAWRQLRDIDVDRDFLMKTEIDNDGSTSESNVMPIESLLQKLADRSPFLTSLSGIGATLYSDAIPSIVRFEHLQSISVDVSQGESGIHMESAVRFLETTRSRTNLKELRLFDVRQHGAPPTITDQFAVMFDNDRQIQSRSISRKLDSLQLEIFEFTSSDRSLRIRLDTMDATRLTELRVGKASIEPDQLTDLIERASNLRHIELSLMRCKTDCHGQCLRPRKNLLSALASHENLTSIMLAAIISCRFAELECMDFESEFMEMLKTIGHRGQLRELGLNTAFVDYIDLGETCTTIRDHIPYLRSIKICGVTEGNMLHITNLTELEEIDFTLTRDPVTTNVVQKIAQLSRLKRLVIDGFADVDTNALKSLADVTTLTDLRIERASSINANVFEKWSDGFASNLETLVLSNVIKKVDHNGKGLARLLEKAVRLRVLILEGRITDQSLKAIAKSCPDLETLRVESTTNEITVRYLQEVVDRCPKLKRLGGFDEIRDKLKYSKYRKIGDVDLKIWKSDPYDSDSDEDEDEENEDDF